MSDLGNLYKSLSLEIAAVARYREHRDMTADPAFFALFEGLMRNEQGHEEELVANIERLGGDLSEVSRVEAPELPTMVYEGEQIMGQKTNLAMLRADLAFEADATKLYHEFAGQAEDEQVKGLFKELSRAERGHVNGLTYVIKSIENGSHEVRFFCPVCGWAVEFGASPEIGTESRCRMCGVLFALDEKDDDFILVRK
jgi:rubrerythrin